MDELGLILRASRLDALATLTRLFNDVDLAEDALQEAFARALTSWRESGGIPDNPTGWLIRSARNYAIDVYRRGELEAKHSDRVAESLGGGASSDWRRITEDSCEPVKDDVVRLVFTCCHPALGEEARIALTLRVIAGLSVGQIASAFLTTPKTMEQRITRAKRKIREDAPPYRTPTAEELPERLSSVLAVVYLVFNEGYMAAQGNEAMTVGLAREAIRIGRIVSGLFRADPEVTGLLALMLLQHARSGGRVDASGDLVPLDEQDRSRWDHGMIAEGRALLERALRHERPGPYQIQAAIAAVHGAARTAEATDWREIVSLYRMLEHHQPSPVVTLNRAVAVAKVEGSAAALPIVESIADRSEMLRYHHFHAVRGQLLRNLGHTDAAFEALTQARELTENQRERAFIERELRAIDAK